MTSTAMMTPAHADFFDNKENWCPLYVSPPTLHHLHHVSHAESCDAPMDGVRSTGHLSSSAAVDDGCFNLSASSSSSAIRVLQDVTDSISSSSSLPSPSSAPSPSADATPRFTFRCRINRSFPSSLISPPHIADPLLTPPTSPSIRPTSLPSADLPTIPIPTLSISASNSSSSDATPIVIDNNGSSSPSEQFVPNSVPTATAIPTTATATIGDAVPSTIPEAGPSISALQDSLVACSIEPPHAPAGPVPTATPLIVRDNYSTLSKRRFGFDTSLSNIQFGYSKSKPYRFTSPLSPDPKNRKRAKVRKYKVKSPGGTLLQRTLRRNHADALRKRFPPRPISPPNPDAIPCLDDDDDEFDDDEDDEIIDDFDDDGDAQVDDIVEMYNQPLSSEPDVVVSVTHSPLHSHPHAIPLSHHHHQQTFVKVHHRHHADGQVTSPPEEELICITSSMLADPALEPVTLKLRPTHSHSTPVLEETGGDGGVGGGAIVYVAHESDF